MLFAFGSIPSMQKSECYFLQWSWYTARLLIGLFAWMVLTLAVMAWSIGIGFISVLWLRWLLPASEVLLFIGVAALILWLIISTVLWIERVLGR